MKKKIIVLLLIVFECLALSGCTLKKVSSADTNGYLVSALGFENSNGKINVLAETIIINTEDTEAEKKLELLSGEGKNIKLAFDELNKKSVQVLEFSHCAVAVIDENISAKQFSQICSYLNGLKDLNLSIRLISAENVRGLLSCEPKSSVAMGYDIVNMLETETFIKGIKYKNRFYEIEAMRNEKIKVLSFPSVRVLQGEYYIDGLAVFKDNSLSLKLDSEQASLYAIATDCQGKGKFMLEGNEYTVKSNVTTVKVPKENSETVVLNISLKTDQDKKLIKEKIEDLFVYSQQMKTDVFSIGNQIYYKNPSVWRIIKKDYYGYYENSRLKVRIK